MIVEDLLSATFLELFGTKRFWRAGARCDECSIPANQRVIEAGLSWDKERTHFTGEVPKWRCQT